MTSKEKKILTEADRALREARRLFLLFYLAPGEDSEDARDVTEQIDKARKALAKLSS